MRYHRLVRHHKPVRYHLLCRSVLLAAVVVTVITAAAACSRSNLPKIDPALGGETTRSETSRNAFALPAPALSNQERRIFEVGDSFFTQNWVSAPASTEGRDGLGPTFNAFACSSCHLHDGRGAPPNERGTPPEEPNQLGLLLRLSIPGTAPNGGPNPHPNYGGQLQVRALPGVPAEGQMDLSYEYLAGAYGDGEPFELRLPTFGVTELAFGSLGDDVLISPRLAPQIVGMGLLEAVPAEVILAAADPNDSDGDGISGRANQVTDSQGNAALGRFGWKAGRASVEEQVAAAFAGDIGITSALFPSENCPAVQIDCGQAPNGGSPEITDSRLASVVLYARTLAVPALRDPEDTEVRRGFSLFSEFGCASCHTSTLETGASDIAALANQTIHPFTDLLLHDMGEGLADGRPEFAANGQEWRTPPLWGLGLIEEVNGRRFLLHDGRARTPAEAILWHGGEAAQSAELFREASAADRAALLKFLESL